VRSSPPGSTVERYIVCLQRLVAAGINGVCRCNGEQLRAAVQVRGINVKVNDEGSVEHYWRAGSLARDDAAALRRG
jgi:hypothetical protein